MQFEPETKRQERSAGLCRARPERRKREAGPNQAGVPLHPPNVQVSPSSSLLQQRLPSRPPPQPHTPCLLALQYFRLFFRVRFDSSLDSTIVRSFLLHRAAYHARPLSAPDASYHHHSQALQQTTSRHALRTSTLPRTYRHCCLVKAPHARSGETYSTKRATRAIANPTPHPPRLVI